MLMINKFWNLTDDNVAVDDQQNSENEQTNEEQPNL